MEVRITFTAWTNDFLTAGIIKDFLEKEKIHFDVSSEKVSSKRPENRLTRKRSALSEAEVKLVEHLLKAYPNDTCAAIKRRLKKRDITMGTSTISRIHVGKHILQKQRVISP